MREIIEQQEAFEDVDILAEAKGVKGYEPAREMLKSGKMPDGTKWNKKKTTPYPVLNGFTAGKIKYKPHGEEMSGSAELKFSPGGKNGHGGVTIDPTASNQFLILEPEGATGLLKAFAEAVKKGSKSVNAQIERWVKTNPKQWFGRIVGVENVVDWKVTDVKLRRVKYGNPSTNHPERRKWPSGRSEIAMPFSVEVQVKAKRK